MLAQEKNYDYKNLQFLSSSIEIRARMRGVMDLHRTPAPKFVPLSPEGHIRMAFVASTHTGPRS